MTRPYEGPPEPLPVPTAYAVSFVPRSGRDVWWCFIVNEPGIIRYVDDNTPACDVCEARGVLERYRAKAANPTVIPDDEVFPDGLHAFVCHIGKPVQSRCFVGKGGAH